VGAFVVGERLGGGDVGAFVGLNIGRGVTWAGVFTTNGPAHSCLHEQGQERTRSVTSLAENPIAWSTPQSKWTWLSHGRKNLLRKFVSSWHFPSKQVPSWRERANSSVLSALFALSLISPSREEDGIGGEMLPLPRMEPTRPSPAHRSARQLPGQRFSSSSTSLGGMPTCTKAWQST